MVIEFTQCRENQQIQTYKIIHHSMACFKADTKNVIFVIQRIYMGANQILGNCFKP